VVAGRRIVAVLLGAAVIPILVSVAVNAATETTFPGPLRLIQRYPWQSVLVGLVATGAYLLWESRSQPTEEVALSTGEQARLRAHLLAETRRIWVDDVLARSLAEVLRLDLSLVSQPSRVTHPVHALLRMPGRGDEPLSLGTAPLEVFTRYGERLLILGEPGGGKTTMLLELARDLLNRAAGDAAANVPVVLSLSSWPEGDDVKFEDWLAAELQRFYDLPEKTARHVIKHEEAALLLDGLDEVPAGRLDRCTEALNAFRDRHGTTPIAVCCRVDDYESSVKRHLKLAGAVLILPLTPAEADAWLASVGPALEGLRAALREDEELRRLLRTPLTLSIAALTYQGRQVPEFTGLDSLFTAYTRRMLDRPRAHGAKTAGYPEREARRWLAWLARGMTAVDATLVTPDLPVQFRAAWVSDAAALKPIPKMLMYRGALPIALIAGTVALVLGPWPAAIVIAALTAATAWTRAEAPTWFTGRYHHGGGVRTAGEEFRREQVAGVLVFALLGVALLCGLTFLRGTWEDMSILDRVVIGAVIMVILPVAFTPGEVLFAAGLSEWVADLSGDIGDALSDRIGHRAAAALALTLAGVTAGGAGVLLARMVTALGTSVVTGVEPPAWALLSVFGAGPLAGLAGGLILAAQYKINELHTPRLAYRLLAAAGEVPPDLGDFLAWADGRILLRRAGGGYLFLHRLYRDWWAGSQVVSS
jgi:hypothetical protein